RGFAYAIIGQYDKSLEDLNKAIELDQHFANAFFSRGNLYLKTGSTQLAVLDFQKACDLGNDNGCQAVHRIDQGFHPE
ncbi:MAG TPA: tetratricopeptide repeat protein, partial [Nitrospirota bacterium]|nr:tetratricopeptide repeat protein [Nitrospirota bacterium]